MKKKWIHSLCYICYFIGLTYGIASLEWALIILNSILIIFFFPYLKNAFEENN